MRTSSASDRGWDPDSRHAVVYAALQRLSSRRNQPARWFQLANASLAVLDRSWVTPQWLPMRPGWISSMASATGVRNDDDPAPKRAQQPRAPDDALPVVIRLGTIAEDDRPSHSDAEDTMAGPQGDCPCGTGTILEATSATAAVLGTAVSAAAAVRVNATGTRNAPPRRVHSRSRPPSRARASARS
jgi:hypothetical protein